MTLIVAIAAGIVLAASAGLRAFMPLFGAGVAGRFLDWRLTPGMEWLASDVALIALGIATVVELAADKFPLVDHLLDTVHTLVGPVAGALVTFSVLADLPAPFRLLTALALGAPVAAGVHAVAAATRLKTTVATGGSLNPAVSVAEDGVSVGAIAVALLLPLLAVVIAVIVMVIVVRVVVRLTRRARPAGAS